MARHCYRHSLKSTRGESIGGLESNFWVQKTQTQPNLACAIGFGFNQE
ncbi:hypothetical protein CEXT_718761, partial [Caerostris extrusa]